MKAEKTNLLIETAIGMAYGNFVLNPKLLNTLCFESNSELKELESKAAKWDDPQTQADLELAQAIKTAFSNGFTVEKGPYWENDFEFKNKEDLSNWFREQKRGEK